MRVGLVFGIVTSNIAALIFSLTAAANTPPSLSTVSNSPEAALGARYHGGLAGQATVSAGGNAVYRLPIEVPPGTAEAIPSLSLVYNSNVDNGLLGLGWFLQGSDSKITRCPQTIAQDGVRHAVNFSLDDRFCLNGNRLIVVSGTYGHSGSEYSTESDQFGRIIAHGNVGNGPSYFTVETKGGHIKYFGNTSDSKVEDETNTHVRMWRLNRDEDRVGNYYTIQYHEDTLQGESYPTRIEYTGNDIAGLTANAAVDLEYETRNDNTVSFQGGSTIHKHPNRLSGLSMKVGGVEAYRYNFTYSETGLQYLSRLDAVERCDAALSCQTPIDIDWLYTGQARAYSATDVTLIANDWAAPGTSVTAYHPRWHDLNGDGRSDYIVNNPTNKQQFRVALSGGSGYTVQTWDNGWGFQQQDAHWVDINGDGRIDLAQAISSGGTTTYRVHISTPTGFTNSVYGTGTERFETHFLDMNGDGLRDLVTVERWLNTAVAAYYYRVYVALNTGSAFGAEVEWAYASLHAELGDLNGDGLTDLITGTRYVFLNDGTQFKPYIDWGSSATAIPPVPTYPQWGFQVEFRDYNKDGLMDRKTTVGGVWKVQLNTGRSFETISDYITHHHNFDVNADTYNDRPLYSVVFMSGGNPRYHRSSLEISHGVNAAGGEGGPLYTPILLPTQAGWDKYSDLADTDGDGFLELTVKHTSVCLTIQNPTNIFTDYTCEEPQERIFENEADRQNLVSKITESSGRQVQFEYDWLASGTVTYTKGTSATLPELDIQDSTRVVKRMLVSDGIGGDFETTYKYEGLKWDLDGRGTLGFAKIISTNTDTGIETTTEYEQSFPLVMQPKLVQQRRVSDGRLLAETNTTYTVNGTVGSGPVFPYVSNNVEKKYALSDGRLLVTKTTNRTVDSYGNTTSLDVETDDAENLEIRKQVATNTFTVDLTNWWVGQLTSSNTAYWLNGASTSADTRTTNYTYGLTYGLLKTTTREPGGGAGIEMTTTRTHDAFGNALTEVVSGPSLTSRTTTIAYDARGQFPTTLTNALGHTVTQAWDPIWGKKTSETDVNGQTTTWTYDSFGMQELETRPDGTTVSTLTYEDPTGSGVGAAFYQEVLETGKAPRRTFVDLLGRTVRERSQSFDGSYVNVDSEYDSQGRLYRQSEPYFSGGFVDWNIFSYDDIGRVTALTAADPVASSTTSYNGFSTTVTDSASRSETQTVDAAGRVVSVVDKDGTPMSITYDAQGNRASVIAAAGTSVASTVTYTYDRYGRMTQQDDPDHGIYSYTYDALGNKLSEVSPEMAFASPAQSRTFSYDVLNRLTSRTEPEGTTTWTYDNTGTGNLGLGKVHSESQSGFSRTFLYGSGNYGRLTDIDTTIGTATYNESKTYDSNGMLASETYPSSVSSSGGYTVEYTYNALGYMERIQHSTGGGGGTQVFYQTVDTNAAGRITEEWLGDGSTVTQTFDGVSARITGQLSQTTATIQQFSYTYDSSGNMLTRSDNLNSLSETFTYDNLDRLTSAAVTGQTAVTFGFDEAGSITSKSDVAGTYDYVMGPTHAVTLLTQGGSSRSLSYDANGNFSLGTNEPTVTWSSYNKPTQLTKGAVTYDFTYGPDRRRHTKQRNTETTHYVGSRFEKRFGGGTDIWRSVIYANGRAIMVREDRVGSTTHKYLHRDHLGSVTAITDEATGNVLDRLSYDAWGLRRIATTWAAGAVTATDIRGYTGHEHLDDIGVIHMNGRIYSPSLGRMLSPDPVTQAPENGQNYNRFTYAFNNPLRHKDPSGYQSCEIGDCGEFVQTNPRGPIRSDGQRITDGWIIQSDYVENPREAGWGGPGHRGWRALLDPDAFLPAHLHNTHTNTSTTGDVLDAATGDPVTSASTHSDTYQSAVDFAQNVVKFVVPEIIDELSDTKGSSPAVSILIDVATEKPPETVFSNAVGAGATVITTMAVGGIVIPTTVGIATTDSVDFLLTDAIEANCSRGARCPTEEFFRRNQRPD